MEHRNTFRYLVKIAGKILFVIGLVLNILMLFFGFWPSLIYILIMIAGAGMFSFNKSVTIQHKTVNEIKEKARNRFTKAFPPLDTNIISLVIKTTVLTLLSLIVAGVLFMWLSKDYFKKRDTRSDCQEIVFALNNYYKSKNKYPTNLSVIINNNPLRQQWSKDSWGHNYLYKISNNGDSFVLISLGKDGRPNSDDDIIFKN